jgi:hypothetical protein
MSLRPLHASLTLALLLGAGAASAAPLTAGGELVTNGGFEATTVDKGTVQTYYGSGYSGWTLGANGVEIRNDVVGAAYQGNNFAELDTSGNSWISQLLGTTKGATYTLTFAYSPRSNVGADSNGIDVYWEGGLVQAITAKGLVGDSAGNNWTTYTYNLVAGGSGSTLKFAAAGLSDTLGGGIDAISVKAASTAVPEPASLALLGLGAAALAFSRRRKRG